MVAKPPVEQEEYRSLQILLDPAEIYAIEIKQPADQQTVLRMERKGQEPWRITSHWNVKADEQKLADFLKAWAALEGELRSSSKELFADYGISEAEAYTIVMSNKEGAPLQSFLLGAKKPGYQSSFLRRSDSADVYLVDRDLFTLLGIYGRAEEAKVEVNTWADLAIAGFDPETIDAVKIVRWQDQAEIVAVDIKKELDQEKDLKRWVAVGQQPVFDLDAKKVKDYLTKIIDTRATKIYDPEAEDYGFDQPLVKVSLASGEEQLEFIVGKEQGQDTGDRYLKNPQGLVFFLRRWAINNVNADISNFFIDNPLRVDQDKITSIKIKAADNVIVLVPDLIAENTDYIDQLKSFKVEEMLVDQKQAQGLGPSAEYSLEIERPDGSSLALDAAKEDGLFTAQLRQKPEAFKISESTFKAVFEGLDKLKTIKEQEEQE